MPLRFHAYVRRTIKRTSDGADEAAVHKAATQLVRTAYHEAGHATVCRILEFPAGEVSIVGDEKMAGYAVSASAQQCSEVWRANGWTSRHGLSPTEARAVVAAAGACAEMYFFKKCSPGFEGAPGSDYETIVLATDGDEDLQRELWAYCSVLVEQYAPVIDALARVLLVKRRLSGEKLNQLIAILRQGTFPPLRVPKRGGQTTCAATKGSSER